jgi:hypothetical protein
MNQHLTKTLSGWNLLLSIESKYAAQFTNYEYLPTNLRLIIPGNIHLLTKENPFYFSAVQQGFGPPQAFFEVSRRSEGKYAEMNLKYASS